MNRIADLSPLRPNRADRLRQVGVTVAEIACLFGTLVGTGVIGTRVAESSGGSLSADATRIAPAGPAFSIWSVIYLGLFAYTVWQWLPGRAADVRARRTGWLVAASMLLNAAWLLVTQVGWLWVSVLVILALAVVLGAVHVRLVELPRGDALTRVVVDGTLGLYLGWVAVATCANITATLVASGVRFSDGVADLAAVVVLAVAAGLGVLFARTFGGRLSIAAAMAWGLAWIAVGRLTDAPASTATAVAAIIAALVVVGAALRARRGTVDRTATATA
ncbi:TspO/MBR family protein [Agilicoccus flavus]|uniref:TspO/MBR family protein n=1 Tax=Agilicoccus flavus TaxID=2775968 RepID=UPI001CF60C62|nr:TspO/MBR family protein [Agilicoccus flavus]